MLRGAIDYVTSERIGGWIYSNASPVIDATVLAFLDSQCVGAGSIDVFRQDLADAGLGDGMLGFNFPITLRDGQDAAQVIIRLEGSDFALIQPDARVAGAAASAPTREQGHSLTSIEWMRGRGWLDQAEFDFLRMLQRLGVYDYSLRRGKAGPGGGMMEAAPEAQRLFDLYCLQDLRLIELPPEGPLLQNVRATVAAEGALPIMALWCQTKGVASVVEGSMNQEDGGENPLAGAIDYSCGPDRILFVDVRCRMSLDDLDPESVRIFLAARPPG